MNNVFLIGNGFDLYHKLPTKYVNFLNTVSFLIDNYNDNFKTVGDVFGNEWFRENDSFICECYDLRKSVYDSTELNKKVINEIVKKAKGNIWFNYFVSSYNKDVGWIDFEKEIAIVSSAFKLIFKNEERIIALKKLDDIYCYIIDKYFNFFFDVFESNGFYINTNKAVEIKQEYLYERPVGSKNYVVNKEKIVETLYNSLRELAYILSIYLSAFIEVPMDDFKTDLTNSIFSEADQIFTLNYTRTYEKIYRKDNVNHIHGSTGTNIILGVNPNDDDFIGSVDTLFLPFKKYYQRVVYKTDLVYVDRIRTHEIFKSVDNNNYLRVFGHSLDVTDKDIIQSLFDMAKKITIYCHNQQIIGTYIKNLITIYGKEDFDKLRIDKDLSFEIADDLVLYNGVKI